LGIDVDRVIIRKAETDNSGMAITIGFDRDRDYMIGVYRAPSGGLHVNWHSMIASDVRNILLNSLTNYISFGRDIFFRATDNQDEQSILQSIQSRNWSDDIVEHGLSVSQHPGYFVTQGYKYIYKITGDIVGYGSDGEPLLRNPIPLSTMMESIPPEWEKEIEDLEASRLHTIGITNDEFNIMFSLETEWKNGDFPNGSKLLYEFGPNIPKLARDVQNPLRMTKDYIERVLDDKQHPDPYYEQSSKNRILQTTPDFSEEEIVDSDEYHTDERMFQSR